jgi:asparagine synthase (glutamine-hydrolysing)
MPGLSLLFSRTNIDAHLAARFKATLKEMHFFNCYDSEILYKDKNIIIGFSGYEGYPVTKYDSGDFVVFLEGKIYNRNKNDISSILNCVADNALWDNTSNLPRVLKEKLVELDGEFWLSAIDKPSQRLLILNDTLGKLPLYYAKSSNGLTISREISFVQKLNNISEFDRFGSAQFLMLRYPLGVRTIFVGIKKLPHASCMIVEDGNVPSAPFRYHQWDIEALRDASTIDGYAEKLLSEAKQAVVNRSASNIAERSVIALSGGLDSRAVLGSLKTADIDILAASSINHARSNSYDVSIAEKVADSLGIEFMKIQLEEPGFEDYEKIAEIKPGLNSVVMANALGLYQAVLERLPYGADFYTGDGGASMKTPYRSQAGIKSKDHFLQQVFHTPAVFDDVDLKRLLGLGITDLIDDFESEISDYPAESWREKYFYYTVFDYLTNFGYEGEDRSRYFFWTQTPFEAIPFYVYALSIPDRFKTGLKLMSRFLKMCDPCLLDIVYADYGARPDSVKARAKLMLKGFMKRHPALLRKIRRIVLPGAYKPGQVEDDILEYVLTSLNRSDSLSGIMDLDYLKQLVHKPISSSRFNLLLSLMLAAVRNRAKT